ncbi:MAG TPA: triose-phosphate isomerase [Actinomycetota bacterium]|nr:triose-phosphate isomerase [Actinomycetota bacterium]
MARRPVIAGNWKMNKTHTEAISLVRTLSYELEERDYDRVEIVVCPPFTALRSVQIVVEEEHIPVALGAQNMHWEPSGAYTGEVSGAFLKAMHCRYVILGHSERRQLLGETDEWVARKVKSALAQDLLPILCVGETLDEREATRTEEIVGRQVRAALSGIDPASIGRLVVAYEPVWAIGSGRAATPEDAQSTCAFIRSVLGELAGDSAQATRIQYGGSVSPGNIASFMAQPDVDGALVGGAALEPKSFAMIVRY